MFYINNRQCPPNTISYIIKPRDTVYKLAQRFNTTIPAIISANPFIDINNLTVGEQICIPRQPIYPSCPEGNYYTIRPGDTLGDIAFRFNISVDDLIEANPAIEPLNLRIGQVICIPLAVPPVTCPNGTMPYTIKKGDTFYSIAQKYGISVNDLINNNPNINPNFLLIGQTICIPQI